VRLPVGPVRGWLVVATLGSLVAVAGCSSSSPPPSSSQRPASPSASSSSTSAAPTWSPPDYGSVTPAVQTYLAFMSAWNSVLTSTKPSTVGVDKYLTGQAKSVFDQAAISDPTQAYRGTPPTSRVLVVTSKLTGTLPQATLSDCPLASPTNPFVVYDVKTGNAVATTPPNVAAPYESTVKLFEVNNHWLITSYTTDFTKTCTR
jgi:hypothetical protein